jgi:hypothetical protein
LEDKYAPQRCTVADIRKITHYLLNDNHKDGAPKSKFLKAFGFSADRPDRLKEALEAHAVINALVATTSTDWGTKYIVECSIASPDGRNPCVRTVWQREAGDGDPILVTAYPTP